MDGRSGASSHVSQGIAWMHMWKESSGGGGVTVAVEGARRSSLASWQALLVPEPGNPCLEVPSTHEAGPAFLQAERVVGTLGWLGCGHQAGQWSATRTKTADSTGWLQSHRAHKH